jgi:hypothetical protein
MPDFYDRRTGSINNLSESQKFMHGLLSDLDSSIDALVAKPSKKAMVASPKKASARMAPKTLVATPKKASPRNK